MATNEQVTQVRLMLGETSTPSLFEDSVLEAWINGASNINGAILEGWKAKAAHYADLVNVTDGAAVREFSDLLDHAQAMIKMYTKLAEGPAAGRSRVGKIVRT